MRAAEVVCVTVFTSPAEETGVSGYIDIDEETSDLVEPDEFSCKELDEQRTGDCEGEELTSLLAGSAEYNPGAASVGVFLVRVIRLRRVIVATALRAALRRIDSITARYMDSK